MAEPADALDLESNGYSVGVQIPLAAPIFWGHRSTVGRDICNVEIGVRFPLAPGRSDYNLHVGCDWLKLIVIKEKFSVLFRFSPLFIFYENDENNMWKLRKRMR